MRYFFTLCAVMCSMAVYAVDLPTTGPLPETSKSSISYSSVEEALTSLRSKPSIIEKTESGWIIISDFSIPREQSIWSFSPKGYPAYPAVAKRTVYEHDGAIYLDLNVLCQADKFSCDSFVRDFKALNDRAIQDMNNSRR